VAEEDDIRDAQAGGHSVFGGSGAARFLACPGSVRLSFGLPDRAGYEAAEGTVAHAVAERWLRSGERPDHLVGTTETVEGFEIPIDKLMLNYIGNYVDWMLDVPGELFVERRVDYSRLTPIPDQGGTADALVLRMFHMTLGDLKYGVANKIFARNNPQVSFYALGALYKWGDEFDIERVTIRIAQPRLGHFDEWATTAGELRDFAEWAKARMALAWDPDPPFSPSAKACQYCRAGRALVCQASLRQAARIADLTFEDETAPGLPIGGQPVAEPLQARSLDTPTLAKLVSWRKWLERLMEAAFDELDRRVKAGEEVEGWELGRGKSSRYFHDPAKAAAFLRAMGLRQEDIENRKMKSPKQIEETLVRMSSARLRTVQTWIAPMVVTRPGGYVLVEAGKKDRTVQHAVDELLDDETANTET
jgi:hypothetical protein